MNVDPIMEKMHCPMAVTATEQPKGEDMFENNITSKVIGMKAWGLCVFTIIKLAGAAGTATITVESCDDFTPTTHPAVAFYYRKMTTNDTFGAWTAVASTGFTTTAGANQIYQVAILANMLGDGDVAVRMVCTEVDGTAVDGAVICQLFNPKYAKSIPDTVLA